MRQWFLPWMMAAVSECSCLSLDPRPPSPKPSLQQSCAAYFEVGIVFGHDVLGARLVLAVPHVDVQLPLLQGQRQALRLLTPHVEPESKSAVLGYMPGDKHVVHTLGMHQGNDISRAEEGMEGQEPIVQTAETVKQQLRERRRGIAAERGI